MAIKTVKDIDVKGKRVLIRVDFNVPLKEGKVSDATRIEKAIPTLKYILENGGKLIIVSHLGRPKGEWKKDFSLKPVAEVLEEKLGEKVTFFPKNILDEKVREELKSLPDKVILLENIRFYPGEKKNDPEFAKILSELGDVYVNDAFGTAHRAHASTEGVARIMPVAVAGFLMEKEIKYLSEMLEKPARPFTLILGGAKVSSKIGVIEHLLEKVDNVLIGGGMSYTFFKAMGRRIGKSLCEDDKLDVARNTLDKADEWNVDFFLPKDHLVVKDFETAEGKRVVPSDVIEDDEMGVDIGAETIESYGKVLEKSSLVVWNGPMGVFEKEEYSVGTRKIAEKLAELEKEGKCKVIVGGGDTVSAANKFGVSQYLTHVSTGGGASLEMMEGKELPGIAALDKK